MAQGSQFYYVSQAVRRSFEDVTFDHILSVTRQILQLFILDAGKALLNVYQLSFVRYQPFFSLSYTVSLPFLIFCCQFVARNQITSTFFSCTCSVVILVHFPPRNQSIVVDFLFYVSRLYDQFRIDHPGLFPQTTQYNLFQVTYMVIYPAIFLAR